MNSIEHLDSEGRTTDLVALGRPLVLLSIIMLLINDHVLKVYSPSWLSGKLSDFAGLFFFPILLSAILNIVCRPLNLKPRYIAFPAFGLTALWFCLIKTQPFFGDLTETFLSHLLSRPTQIVCDPTDLMALVMLLPAWRLRSMTEWQQNAGNTKLSYLALCAASIATLATSPVPVREIRHLIVHDNSIYTYFYDDEIFYSSDAGVTWIEVDFGLPKQVEDKLGYPPELPVTVCLPDDSNICYRTGQESIIQSLDGGRTWNTSWSLPAGRREFMERTSNVYVDLGPYDLVLLEPHGKHVLIAAMGTEGILVKTDDGPWEGIAINDAGPISYGAHDLREATSSVDTEINTISLIAVVFLLLNMLANVSKRDSMGYSLLKKALLAAGISFALIILLLPYIYSISGVVLLGVGIIFSVSLLMFIILLFQQLLTNTRKQGKKDLIILIAIWLTSCSLFVFWAYGMIPFYETAFNTALILNMAYLLWFLYQFTIRNRVGPLPPPVDP